MKPHVAAALDAELARTDPATIEMREAREQHFAHLDRDYRPARAKRALPPIPDYDNLQLHRGVLRTPDGDIPVKQIGKGFFSTIYREQGGAGRVFAVSSDDTYDKEILANTDTDNPHIPKVTKLGMTADKAVYTMPFYRTPLRKTDSPEGWRDYTLIKKCHADARAKRHRLGAPFDPYELGYSASFDTVQCAKDVGVRPQVAEALEKLMNESANYGSTYGFEFSPRNLATDDEGNLVLLDVLYDLEAVQKRRARGR